MDKPTIYGALGVFGTSCAFVMGVLIVGVDENTVPIVTSVLSLGGMICVTVLSSQRTVHKVENVEAKVDDVLNGVMAGKIKNVIVETLDDAVLDETAIAEVRAENGNVTES